MKYRSIVRAQDGLSRRVVSIREIVIPDVRFLTLFLVEDYWVPAVLKMYDDLVELMRCIESGAELPPVLFIPNLWSIALDLPEEECELMIDFWHLGHDLALETDYERADESALAIAANKLFDTPGTLYLNHA